MQLDPFLSGCAGIAISWTLALSTAAQAQPLSAPLVGTSQHRQYEPASVKAAPKLKCQLHAPGEPPESGISILTDADGYARFHAVRAAPGTRPESLSCTDETGEASSLSVDLSAAEVFASRPLDISREPGIDRPALAGDPARLSETELLQQGYGLRPRVDDSQYQSWLEAARGTGRMLLRKTTDRHLHTVTTQQGGSWIGTVMTGSAPYTSISATFVVPTAIPGAFGTKATEAALWPGLGGFGTGSGLIQAGITLQTSATTAAYGSWREYCCGDGDSNGYGGAFVPAPGDKIFAQAWYCDSQGNASLNGGYGCSYMYNFRSGAVFSCTKPRGTPGSTPCWSVAALPLCSVSPRTANCMTVGSAAEFILENQSGQLTPPTNQFPPFKPAIAMTGSATGANGTVTLASDPTVILLTDFPHGPPKINVSLSGGTTNFQTYPWNEFVLEPARSAGAASRIAGVSRQPGTMEIFWIAADGSVQDAFWYDGAPWKRFQLAPPGSAAPTAGIAAVSRLPGTMEVFWTAPNGSVQDAFWYENSTWKRFELAPAGSAATTSPMVVLSRIPTSMELFWTAPNGSVQDAFWYDGATWKRFELAPPGSAAVAGGMAGVSRILTSMELFWTAPNGSVQDAYWYAGSTWKRFELAPVNSASNSGAITAVSRKPGTIEVFWTAPNGSVQDAFWYENSTWKRFQLAPAGSASTKGGIKAVARAPGTIEVWWVGADGSVQDAFWYENAQWARFQLATSGRASAVSGLTGLSRIPGSMEIWFIAPDGSVVDDYYYDL